MEPLWTRQEQESSHAYSSFEVYRDMGPKRSIQKVGNRLAKNPKSLARLSKKYQWVKRANAYDVHIGEKKGEATAEEAVKTIRWQARKLRSCQKAALEVIKEFNMRLLDKGLCINDTTLSILMPRFFKVFMDIAAAERELLGIKKTMAHPVTEEIDTQDALQKTLSAKCLDKKSASKKTPLHKRVLSQRVASDGERIPSSREHTSRNKTVLRRRTNLKLLMSNSGSNKNHKNRRIS